MKKGVEICSFVNDLEVFQIAVGDIQDLIGAPGDCRDYWLVLPDNKVTASSAGYLLGNDLQ